MIGVLHHIYTRSDQQKAVGEALRVVKPGGRVLIRESNLKNPLFRIFWNYVFPLTAKMGVWSRSSSAPRCARWRRTRDDRTLAIPVRARGTLGAPSAGRTQAAAAGVGTCRP